MNTAISSTSNINMTWNRVLERQSIVEAAAQFGLPRPTFYKAQADFERAGLVGLLPAKRGRRGAHKITDEVLRFVEQVRAEEGEFDGQALAERIARCFGQPRKCRKQAL